LAGTTRQLASFFLFDISGLTAPDVNDPGFVATFRFEVQSVLNTLVDMPLNLGRNTSGAWNDSGTSNPLHDWGFADETSAVAAADVQLLNSDVRNYSDGDTVEVDVTTIVKDWVLGNTTNQGFVLFGSNDNQGIGVLTPELETVVPEPGSLALVGLGGLCLLRRRRS